MLDKQIAQTFDRRAALFITGMAVLTSMLVLRMLQMQVFQHGKYKKLSENNATRIRVNLPERGKILSAEGSALARDENVYRIYVIPSEAEDLDALIDACRHELSLKPNDLDRIDKKIKKQRPFQPVIIKESANWQQLARLHAIGLSGLHIESGFSRRYPGKSLASHVIGYVGGLELTKPNSRMLDTSPFLMTGMSGLEKQYNTELAGAPGQSVIQIDAAGKIIGPDASREVPAEDGRTIKTTIRESVQKKLEAGLEPHKAAAGVAIEIATGNIIAMASAPGFNPDSFRSDIGADIMENLRKNPMKPFMNKAIEGLYPPGSTFKIVVALAALESGAITPSEKIYCPGHWEYGKHLYHCWEKRGHGWVDLEGAMAHSCDTYFYQIALRIGIDAIKNMALRLGLAQKLLNELPRESPGVIPDRTWKEKNVGVRWQHGDTIISGIGQGFILSNCLQLCVMTARAVSNKIVMPRLVVDEMRDQEFESLGLQEKNIKIIISGMENVLKEGGTAAGYAINVKGMKMGGKTGTSQVRRISEDERAKGVRSNEQLPRHLRNHGLFIGFAPTDRPRYAIATIAEHAGGSSPAAKVAADTMREILKNQ
ncbi:MAG: penicillin-binding protein 2 [Rickettsiales bacterium]|jgi:penicillin-binding protein 2|nr:penicillin-binding protein 2 [Rickettsiales bacterium]